MVTAGAAKTTFKEYAIHAAFVRSAAIIKAKDIAHYFVKRLVKHGCNCQYFKSKVSNQAKALANAVDKAVDKEVTIHG